MHHNKHLLSTKNIKYSSKKSLEEYLMFCVGRMQYCFSGGSSRNESGVRMETELPFQVAVEEAQEYAREEHDVFSAFENWRL
jgi:hypothetical protein